MHRKKIIYLITKSNFGGAQRYVFDLATSMPKDEYDVSVVFGGTGKAGSEPGALAEMLSRSGIRTIYVPELGRDVAALMGVHMLLNPSTLWHSISQEARALNALKRLFKTECPHVVHLNSSKAGGLGALAARMAHVPHIIFTAHGWPFWEPRAFPIRALIFLFSYLTVLLSHKTIVISHHDKAAIAHLPFVRKKIAVIYNGIRAEGEAVTRTPSDARAVLYPLETQQVHKYDLWLVSIAELTPNKNIFRAVDAVRHVNEQGISPRVFYTIIGGGEQAAALAEYISARGLNDSIHLCGFIPDAARLLSGFDALLLPSLKEGLPYVLLEAGAAHTAAIASRIGGIPEIIEHGVSGLLIDDPTATPAIAAQIMEVRDVNKRTRMATTLHQTVVDHFSFETMRQETLSLYR